MTLCHSCLKLSDKLSCLRLCHCCISTNENRIFSKLMVLHCMKNVRRLISNYCKQLHFLSVEFQLDCTLIFLDFIFNLTVLYKSMFILKFIYCYNSCQKRYTITFLILRIIFISADFCLFFFFKSTFPFPPKNK